MGTPGRGLPEQTASGVGGLERGAPALCLSGKTRMSRVLPGPDREGSRRGQGHLLRGAGLDGHLHDTGVGPWRVRLHLTSPWGWWQACHQHEWLLFSFGSCSYSTFSPFFIQNNKNQANILFLSACPFGCLLHRPEVRDFLVHESATPTSSLALLSARQVRSQWTFWKTTPRDTRRQPWPTMPHSGRALSPRRRCSLCPRGSRYDLLVGEELQKSDSLDSRMLRKPYFKLKNQKNCFWSEYYNNHFTLRSRKSPGLGSHP